MRSQPRGLLIVFEGLDRSGKSTQCQKLHDALLATGEKVRLVRFPDRTIPTGQLIDQYLRNSSSSPLSDQAIHLLFATNRWEAADRMEADLEAGTTLIVDRYSFSGAVYSAAKGDPALDLNWAWSPEVGLPRPDITFYLMVSAAVAQQRSGYGEERYEKREFQAQVARWFDRLFDEGLKMSPEEFERVDADSGVEEVHSGILKRAAGLLEEAKSTHSALRRFGDLLPRGSK